MLYVPLARVLTRVVFLFYPKAFVMDELKRMNQLGIADIDQVKPFVDPQQQPPLPLLMSTPMPELQPATPTPTPTLTPSMYPPVPALTK